MLLLSVYLLTGVTSVKLLTKQLEEPYLDQKRRVLEDLSFAQHRRSKPFNQTRTWKPYVDISFDPEISQLPDSDKKPQESPKQSAEQLKLCHQFNSDCRKVHNNRNETDTNTVTNHDGKDDEFVRKTNAPLRKINVLQMKLEQTLSRQPNYTSIDPIMYRDIQMQKAEQSKNDIKYS